MTDSTTSTPKVVWCGIALMVAAVAVPVAGYLRSQTMSGDFGPIGFVLVTLGGGVMLGVAGIVCVVIGARRRPRSLTTKAALVLAALFSVPAIYVGIELARIFTEASR